MSAETRAQTILTLIKSGNAIDALEKARSAAASFPKSGLTQHMLGLALRASGDLPAAILPLQAATDLEPENHEFWNTLGNVLKKTDQLDAAEDAYRKSIGAKNDYASAWTNLCALLRAEARFDDSADEAQNFIKAVGTADAHLAHGLALEGAGKIPEALIAFENALQCDRQLEEAQYKRAGCLIELGRAAEAEPVFASLTKSKRLSNQAHYMLGRARMEQGNPDGAETPMLTAIRSGSAQALKDYANLVWMRGRDEEAKQLLLGAAGAFSYRPEQAIIGLHGLIRMEAYSELREALNRLPQDALNRGDVLSLRSILASETGELDTAYSLGKRALQHNPTDPALIVQQIITTLMIGNYSEALSQATKFGETHPLDQQWVALQSTALKMLGENKAYNRLCDPERFILRRKLPVPDQWPSFSAFRDDLMRIAETASVFRTHPLDQSARKGVQTPRNLRHEQGPVIPAYVSALGGPVAEYLNHIGDDPSHPLSSRNRGEFKIGGIWSITLRKDGHHINHIHPMGWVSSACYLKVPDEVRPGSDSKAGWIKFGEPSFKMPDPCPPDHWEKPEEGDLVLFPAYMWHGTEPLQENAPRVTMPFDVLPK